jgi:hypothetical protein
MRSFEVATGWEMKLRHAISQELSFAAMLPKRLVTMTGSRPQKRDVHAELPTTRIGLPEEQFAGRWLKNGYFGVAADGLNNFSPFTW